MRTLNYNEVESVSAGWNPWGIFVGAVFVYDAATDFVDGFKEGWNEVQSSAE